MYTANDNTAEATGRQFEKYCSNRAGHFFGQKHFQSKVGTFEDNREGTDGVLDGIRVDWTTNPEKDHTEWLQKRAFRFDKFGEPEAWIVSGVRTGSNHGPFKVPVLIIRLEYDCSFSKAISSLDWDFKQLYNRCLFDFLDWVDAHDLMDVVLPE